MYRPGYGETKYYGNYGRRRYSSRYDEYDEDDLDESDFEECDVDTEEVYAHSLIDITGEKLKLNKLTLDEDKLIAKTPLREGPGYGYSISEATGNEGATKDLWYHRGAVILWPKERSFELATKMDVEYAIHLLQTELQQPKPKNNKYGRHIIQLAAHIIKKHHDYEINGIATEIIQIGNIPLLKEFLQKYMSRGFDVDAKIIKQILERFGWQHFAETIHNYLIKQNSIQWLKSLMLEYAYIPEDGIPLMSEWVTELWQAELEPKYGHNSYTQKSITNVIPTVLWLNLDNLIDKIIERLATQEAPEFLTDTYGPALVDILKMLKKHYYDPLSFKKFTDDIQKRIATTLPKAPDAPTNWAREGRLNCDCPFCTKINEFLPDPKQDKIIFSKTLKRNLTHIESEISKSQVDLEVIIRRTPPKFEGICKKNSSNYNRRLDLFNRAQQILQDLGY
ncbi:hypothetical protein TI05_13440 [Achromatium sp. WMS3]|nr:hypothetical protein TI05_13440 [Achromatium sp. WMS3]